MASRILSLFNCAGDSSADKKRPKRQKKRQGRRAAGDELDAGGRRMPGEKNVLEEEYGGLAAASASSDSLGWRSFHYLSGDYLSCPYSLARVHFADRRPTRVRLGFIADSSAEDPQFWCLLSGGRQERQEGRLVSLRPSYSFESQPLSSSKHSVPHAIVINGGCPTACRNLECARGLLLAQLGGQLYLAPLLRPQETRSLMTDCAAFCIGQQSLLFAVSSTDSTLSCATLSSLMGIVEHSTEGRRPVWRHRWLLKSLLASNSREDDCEDQEANEADDPEESEDEDDHEADLPPCPCHTLAHWPEGRRLFIATKNRVWSLDVSRVDAAEAEDDDEDDDDAEESMPASAMEATSAFCLRFREVADLAVDPRGLLFVCDRLACRVRAFDARSGRHLTDLGGREFQPDVLLMERILPQLALHFRQPGRLRYPRSVCAYQRPGVDGSVSFLLLVTGGFGCVGQTFDVTELAGQRA